MNADNYKAAKSRSRITNLDIWLHAVQITVDQDKSFSSGRTPIPEEVEKRLDHLLLSLETGAVELEAELRQALPECTISLDSASLNITIGFPQGKDAVLMMRGVDMLNHAQMYDVDRSGAGAATFVRMSQPTWKQDDKNRTRRWYLWRGDFVENRDKKLQNYWNILTGELLREALKRYAPVSQRIGQR
ncbi:hypothetical protein OHK33_11920 [Pectobacterium aroidearum]|uniref:hypothetical protein n=1 Tax=Pectobacterium aroidearum TaxID=1201031 RepID=UPI003306BAE6